MNTIIPNAPQKKLLGDVIGWMNESVMISTLSNLHIYNLRQCHILQAGDMYFLLAAPQGAPGYRVTARNRREDAEALFIRRHGRRALLPQPPEWSVFYPVSIQWLNGVFSGILETEFEIGEEILAGSNANRNCLLHVKICFELRDEDILGVGDPQKDRLLRDIMKTIYNNGALFIELVKEYIPELIRLDHLKQAEIRAMLAQKPFRALAERAAALVSGEAERLVRDIYNGADPDMDGDKLEGFIYQPVYHIQLEGVDTALNPAGATVP